MATSSDTSDSTPRSLLVALKDGPRSANWEPFVYLYEPILYRWLSQYPLQPSDAADLVQETLLVVYRKIPEFEHNGRTGAFRNWLKAIMLNHLRTFFRNRSRQAPVESLNTTLVPDEQDQLTTAAEDEEYRRELLRRLMQLVRSQTTPQHWDVFFRTTVLGESPPVVAQQLGLSLNAVYLVRSRLLREFRTLAHGFLTNDEK